MKSPITEEQRRVIGRLLDEGVDRTSIADQAGVTLGQVSALMAHRTLRIRQRQARFVTPQTQDEERVNSRPSPIGSLNNIRSRIPLGLDVQTGAVVCWDLDAASNPHMLIVGESGSGKTYTASRLVFELAERGFPSVIIDYGQGFSLVPAPVRYRETVRVLELNLGRDGISLNPMEIFPTDLLGPITVAQRVADTFVRVYPRLGVQQHSLLRNAVLEVLSESGIRSDDQQTWSRPLPPFRDLEAKVIEYTTRSDTSTRRIAGTLAPHISTLFFFNTFRKTGRSLVWSDLIRNRKNIWVLQLGGLEDSVQRAVTEFLLWNLYRYIESQGPCPLRIFVILDEAHRLAFSQGAPVERILREGRKFGMGLILASQQPEDFNSVAFGNTATKLAFQTVDTSGRVARQLSRKLSQDNRVEVARNLSSLPRGTAYVVSSNTGSITKLFSFENGPSHHEPGSQIVEVCPE